jgi:hypothetical protein
MRVNKVAKSGGVRTVVNVADPDDLDLFLSLVGPRLPAGLATDLRRLCTGLQGPNGCQALGDFVKRHPNRAE